MKDRFEPLESGEVISVQQDTPVLVGQRTFRVGELNEAIKKQLESAIESWSEDKSAWFSPNGIDCEALRFGASGWQKGRIRLCLEFSPDEPNPPAESVSDKILPMTVTMTPASHVAAIDAHTQDNNNEASVLKAIAEPTVMTVPPDPVVLDLPLAGTVIAEADIVDDSAQNVAAPALPHLADLPADLIAEPLNTQMEAPMMQSSHLTEAILVTEEDSVDRHGEGMDEISFEFDGNNGDLRGTIVADGMMELDLSDLDLDRAEHDYLNFETNGISEGSLELMNFQDLGNAENSGMLIDEVWNEISQQPSWPGIH
jgi:hypothetical protein